MKILWFGLLLAFVGPHYAFDLTPHHNKPPFEQVRVLCDKADTPACVTQCERLCYSIRTPTALRWCLDEYNTIECPADSLPVARLRSYPVAVCSEDDRIAVTIETTNELLALLRNALRVYLSVVVTPTATGPTPPDAATGSLRQEAQKVGIRLTPDAAVNWTDHCQVVGDSSVAGAENGDASVTGRSEMVAMQFRPSPWLLAVEVPVDELISAQMSAIEWRQAGPHQLVYSGMDVGVGCLEVLGF